MLRNATRAWRVFRRALVSTAVSQPVRGRALIHPAHTAAGTAALRRTLLLLWNVTDERFGRQQQRGDRRRVLQRRPHHLGGVYDTGLDEILVRVGQCVESFRI